MGEGLVYPCLSTALSNSESSPKDLNDIIFYICSKSTLY
jgi:hypothetical protein